MQLSRGKITYMRKEVLVPTFLKLTPSFYHNFNPTLWVLFNICFHPN